MNGYEIVRFKSGFDFIVGGGYDIEYMAIFPEYCGIKKDLGRFIYISSRQRYGSGSSKLLYRLG